MERILAPLRAAADESRLRILWMLEERELCVCEIQAVLGLAQSTVSRHLQVLEDAGLLASERNGPWKNYRLNPSPPPLVQSLLGQLRMAGQASPEARAVRENAATACREDLCRGNAA